MVFTSVVLYKVDISHKLEQPIIRSQQLISAQWSYTEMAAQNWEALEEKNGSVTDRILGLVK